MLRRPPLARRCILSPLAATLVVFALGSGRVTAGTITRIINVPGNRAGNGLVAPQGIAVDAAGNIWVAGSGSDKALKITLDSDGDGVDNVSDVCPDTPADLPVAPDDRQAGQII